MASPIARTDFSAGLNSPSAADVNSGALTGCLGAEARQGHVYRGLHTPGTGKIRMVSLAHGKMKGKSKPYRRVYAVA